MEKQITFIETIYKNLHGSTAKLHRTKIIHRNTKIHKIKNIFIKSKTISNIPINQGEFLTLMIFRRNTEINYCLKNKFN